MTLVLRLIKQSRWDSPGKSDWLPEGDIPADPLADFANVSDNCLSLWFVDDDKKDLPRVVAALAASREKADKLDYVLFAQGHLELAAAEIHETNGTTLDEHVNGYHRDLTRLSAANVLALTKRVWHENLELKRINKQTVVELVADAVHHGRISLTKLRPKLLKCIKDNLDDQRDRPLRPR